jgi:hypothetical protein
MSGGFIYHTEVARRPKEEGMRIYRRIWVILCLTALLAACGQTGTTDEISPEQLAETIVAKTAAAGITISEPTEVPAAAPTGTEVPPTDTPLPEPTPTPGLIVFNDDFSGDSGQWGECAECEWVSGALVMGPYPSSIYADAYYAICEACGMASNYRMSVDVTFAEGASDRGFGLLVAETDDYVVTFEIATWQVAGLFKYEPARGAWSEYYGWAYKPSVINPGRGTNQIEVIVQDSRVAGKSDITLKINGKTLTVYSGIKVDPTRVGLELGWHSIGVVFDNFEFEELEPPSY